LQSLTNLAFHKQFQGGVMRVKGSFLSVVATTSALALLVAAGVMCQKSQSSKTEAPQAGTSTTMPGTGTAMMGGTTMMSDSSMNNAQTSESANYNQTGTATEYYTCSMHPQVHQAKPGKCPICEMSLVFHKADKTSK
jgi:negative regulator of sigma E activity